MHELGIASSIHRTCLEVLAGRGRLERVRVAVGELSAVEPDLLRFAWQAVTEGGPDEGAELEIDWCPARQLCADCGKIDGRVPGTWLRLCPRCDQPLRVEGGDELKVVDLSFTPEARRSDDVQRTRGSPATSPGR